MSLQYFKKASQKKSEASGEEPVPQVNRFSDVRRVNQRRHEVLDYLLLGYDEQDIAGFLGESVPTIENDIEHIAKAGYEAREEEVDMVRDELMRYYRTFIREAHRAWKNSQGEVETITTEYGEGGEGPNGASKIESQKIKTEEKSGDARHLKNAIDAAKEMGKVTGAQKHREMQVVQQMQLNNTHILSPDTKSDMPEEFDRWVKKPDDAQLPEGRRIKPEE